MTYLDWLAMIAFPDGAQRSQYSRVLNKMLQRDFTVTLEGDRNRCTDGLYLRSVFEEDTGMGCDKSGDCSVLEVLVALAIRCENQLMWDPDEGDRTSLWFWEMFYNLGLDSLSDDYYDEGEFRSIMRHFCDRNYSCDGFGGPFCVTNFEGDMTKIDLWSQLGYYLESKFL